MSSLAIDVLGVAAGPTAVGARIAEWCRPYSAKELARLVDAEVRTAKSWKAGCLPSMRHLTAMVERWGSEFLEFIFAPVLADRRPLPERLERLERELGAIRREVVHAQAAIHAGALSGAGAPGAGGAGDAEREQAPGARLRTRSVAAATAATGRALLAILVLTGLMGAADDVVARVPRRVDARPPVVRSLRDGR